MDLNTIAEKYGVSREIAEDLLAKLRCTGGKQVQFSHEALGGMGQWSAGMVMIGRMNDDALKAKVNDLCTELARMASTGSPEEETGVTNRQVATPPDNTPSATAAGSQNGTRYAYFASDDRLVIEQNGVEMTYDASGYRITGVAQDQAGGAPGTLRFTTAGGDVVDLHALKKVP